MHRVATDSELLHRAEQLETTVDNGNYVEFCERACSRLLAGLRGRSCELSRPGCARGCVALASGAVKASTAAQEQDYLEWNFMRVLQETESRIKFSALLGFNALELEERLAKLGLAEPPPEAAPAAPASEAAPAASPAAPTPRNAVRLAARLDVAFMFRCQRGRPSACSPRRTRRRKSLRLRSPPRRPRRPKRPSRPRRPSTWR